MRGARARHFACDRTKNQVATVASRAAPPFTAT
jgi:hypothetical protein